MEIEFTCAPFGGTLEAIPKGAAVYKIFDLNGELIVLDKTSNLFEKLDRYFGPRTEPFKDLDLRAITSRIEFRRTWSPFETAYVLYLERRRYFPKTYRKMRTFRTFSLMKINRKQRFPRLYASRQIKAGVEYFGPFSSHAQFTRLKAALERTFKLRPCLYNIRGNDPHPDCMYFQMHTCSRPCNNDINRAGYLSDIDAAIQFVQGRDAGLNARMLDEIAQLSEAENFEEAELIRRRLEKVRSARKEIKETFASIWSFNYVVVLSSESVTRVRIALVRAGNIVALEDYPVGELGEILPAALERGFSGPLPATNRQWQYDEFCLVAQFLLDPLKSVDLAPLEGIRETTAQVEMLIQRRKKQKAATLAEQPAD